MATNRTRFAKRLKLLTAKFPATAGQGRQNRPTDDLEIIARPTISLSKHHQDKTRASGEPSSFIRWKCHWCWPYMKLDSTAISAGCCTMPLKIRRDDEDVRREFGDQ